MQYTVTCAVNNQIIDSLTCTHEDPLEALRLVLDQIESYALRELKSDQGYAVQFMTHVGPTTAIKWYHYDARLQVNYKRPRGDDNDERISIVLKPQPVYHDRYAFQKYIGGLYE